MLLEAETSEQSSNSPPNKPKVDDRNPTKATTSAAMGTVHSDLVSYYKKFSYVSRSCKLSHRDEKLLFQQCLLDSVKPGNLYPMQSLALSDGNEHADKYLNLFGGVKIPSFFWHR
jgi:hypothetical protein